MLLYALLMQNVELMFLLNLVQTLELKVQKNVNTLVKVFFQEL